MDFTYIIAGFISLLVGFVGASVFVIVRGQSFWRLLAATVAVALAADFTLLLDWSHAAEMSASFLLVDLAFFTVYAFVGCPVGAALPLAGRALYRHFRSASGN